MKLIKFLLAVAAGFGIVEFFRYVITELDLNDDENDIYEEDEYPLFV